MTREWLLSLSLSKKRQKKVNSRDGPFRPQYTFLVAGGEGMPYCPVSGIASDTSNVLSNYPKLIAVPTSSIAQKDRVT